MITNIDVSILLFVQENLRSEILNPIWIFITHLGDEGLLWIALGVALLCFKKTRWVGVGVLLALLLDLLVVNVTLKELIARPRPYVYDTNIIRLIPKPGEFSFPSGHTASSFAAAYVIYKKMPKTYGIAALVMATLIGLSRIYVGVHYPTDVIGGAIIGVMCGIWSCYFVRLVQEKLEKK